jgi:hypothetical protein
MFVVDKIDLLITRMERLKSNLPSYAFGGMPRLLYDLFSADDKPGALKSPSGSSAAPQASGTRLPALAAARRQAAPGTGEASAITTRF